MEDLSVGERRYSDHRQRRPTHRGSSHILWNTRKLNWITDCHELYFQEHALDSHAECAQCDVRSSTGVSSGKAGVSE
jgi:hypothetical protein